LLSPPSDCFAGLLHVLIELDIQSPLLLALSSCGDSDRFIQSFWVFTMLLTCILSKLTNIKVVRLDSFTQIPSFSSFVFPLNSMSFFLTVKLERWMSYTSPFPLPSRSFLPPPSRHNLPHMSLVAHLFFCSDLLVSSSPPRP